MPHRATLSAVDSTPRAGVSSVVFAVLMVWAALIFGLGATGALVCLDLALRGPARSEPLQLQFPHPDTAPDEARPGVELQRLRRQIGRPGVSSGRRRYSGLLGPRVGFASVGHHARH